MSGHYIYNIYVSFYTGLYGHTQAFCAYLGNGQRWVGMVRAEGSLGG